MRSGLDSAEDDFKKWLSPSVVVDSSGFPLLLEHRTNGEFDTLDPSKTVDGGLHFGTSEQASMRAGKGSRVIRGSCPGKWCN